MSAMGKHEPPGGVPGGSLGCWSYLMALTNAVQASALNAITGPASALESFTWTPSAGVRTVTQSSVE